MRVSFLWLFLLNFLIWARPEARALECSFLSQETLGKELLTEINQKPFSCIKNRVHFTFDDGPSEKVTPLLIDELSKRKITATFFVSTTNLEPGDLTKDPKQERNQKNRDIVARELKEGHTVASHGHEHNAYDLRITSGQDKKDLVNPGYTEKEREEQIKRSKELLDLATKNVMKDGKPYPFSNQPDLLFRFPYGRGAMPSQKELEFMAGKSNEKCSMNFTSNGYENRLKEYRTKSGALDDLSQFGFSHVGWNHDSKDSGGKYSNLKNELSAEEKNKLVKEYVRDNLEKLCDSNNGLNAKPTTKVALYHDIQPINKDALPLIMDLGKCMGLSFISSSAMMKTEGLKTAGIIVDRNKDAEAVIANTISVVENLNKPENACEKKPVDSSDKTCKSEYTARVFKNCEGEDSICFDGEFYNKKYHEEFLKQRCPDLFKAESTSSY